MCTMRMQRLALRESTTPWWLQVHSASQGNEVAINGRVYELMATVGISTMAAFQSSPTSARGILLQQHFGHFHDFTKVLRPRFCGLKGFLRPRNQFGSSCVRRLALLCEHLWLPSVSRCEHADFNHFRQFPLVRTQK